MQGRSGMRTAPTDAACAQHVVWIHRPLPQMLYPLQVWPLALQSAACTSHSPQGMQGVHRDAEGH